MWRGAERSVVGTRCMHGFELCRTSEDVLIGKLWRFYNEIKDSNPKF
jgi:hypothetical protein